MQNAQVTSHHLLSGGRYPVLRMFGILYLIMACVSVLAGIAFACYYLATAQANWAGRWIGFGEILAGTFFACVSLFLIAEVIKLVIDVEHNSRMCAMALTSRLDLLQQQVVTATAPIPAETVVAPTSATGMPGNGTGSRVAVFFHTPDEETAEAALVRGH